MTIIEGDTAALMEKLDAIIRALAEIVEQLKRIADGR
jgi:hypothetical protein